MLCLRSALCAKMRCMASRVPAQYLPYIHRYGPLVDALARKDYGISGDALLAKLAQGESGFRENAKSSAGAEYLTQFTPGSRQAAIRKYGIDPWRSPDEAFHAAALHLLGKINGSKGLAGYNPGEAGYTRYILDQKVGDVHTGGSVAPPSTTDGGGGVGDPQLPEPGNAGIADLLGAFQSKRQAVPVGQLETPSFSADQKYLRMAGQSPQPVGNPMPKQSVTDQLGALSQLLGPDMTDQAGRGQTPAGSTGEPGVGRTSLARGRGQLVLSPSANRSGAPLTPGIVKVVDAISAQVGHPLQIGTGTNHNQFVQGRPGVQSDHWTGNAVDIPASGSDLTQLGQEALMALGVDPKTARQQKGGVYNIPYGKNRRIQIIFNTHEGGDHFNHLHVGVTPLGGR